MCLNFVLECREVLPMKETDSEITSVFRVRLSRIVADRSNKIFVVISHDCQDFQRTCVYSEASKIVQWMSDKTIATQKQKKAEVLTNQQYSCFADIALTVSCCILQLESLVFAAWKWDISFWNLVIAAFWERKHAPKTVFGGHSRWSQASTNGCVHQTCRRHLLQNFPAQRSQPDPGLSNG